MGHVFVYTSRTTEVAASLRTPVFFYGSPQKTKFPLHVYIFILLWSGLMFVSCVISDRMGETILVNEVLSIWAINKHGYGSKSVVGCDVKKASEEVSSLYHDRTTCNLFAYPHLAISLIDYMSFVVITTR